MGTTITMNAGTGLHSLSDDEFKQLIASGGTMKIDQINARLQGPYIGVVFILALGIPVRQERRAYHIDARDFNLLAMRIAAHVLSKAGGAA
ncbi:hypothetical protein ACCQ08_03075 [Comamonas sp. SY3]|uniref:hypothetical protein n=1 Tax=Comamonas sp. SY3 TaxID=3243601 RepID=UPI0035944CB8